MSYEPVVLTYGQVLLLLIFAAAGLSKLWSLEAFEGVVYNYRILPESAVRPVAHLLPVAEIAIAIGLVFIQTAPAAAVGAVLLLITFNVAVGVNLARGRREIDCGCFSSSLKQRLSGSLLLRNLFLMGLAVPIFLFGGAEPFGHALWLVGAAAALVTVFIYATGTLLMQYWRDGIIGRRSAEEG